MLTHLHYIIYHPLAPRQTSKFRPLSPIATANKKTVPKGRLSAAVPPFLPLPMVYSICLSWQKPYPSQSLGSSLDEAGHDNGTLPSQPTKLGKAKLFCLQLPGPFILGSDARFTPTPSSLDPALRITSPVLSL
jgi:hypothetical protein